MTITSDPTNLFEQRLSWVLAEFTRVGRLLEEDGVWACDIGAVALGYLCDRVRLRREVVTGVYQHPTLAAYARATGQSETDVLTRNSFDELHTWTIIYAPEGEALLIDPNGEVRGEPRMQPLARAVRYAAFPETSEWHELPRGVRAEDLTGWDKRLDEALRLFEGPPDKLSINPPALD